MCGKIQWNLNPQRDWDYLGSLWPWLFQGSHEDQSLTGMYSRENGGRGIENSKPRQCSWGIFLSSILIYNLVKVYLKHHQSFVFYRTCIRESIMAFYLIFVHRCAFPTIQPAPREKKLFYSSSHFCQAQSWIRCVLNKNHLSWSASLS